MPLPLSRGTSIAPFRRDPSIPEVTMGEDRRPNLGAQDFPERAETPREIPADQLERQAKLLRDRKRADGHEPPPSEGRQNE